MPKPDKRPFLIKAYNRAAPLVGMGKTLDFDRLIRKARSNSGLKDLGPSFNERALKELLRSVNEEAKLHPFGALMLKEKLISQLENRLWAEHWFSKYPEILDQELLPIVLVTGLQRTGTTKMQRLLSELTGARALLSWEALYPAPLGDIYESKRRLSRTRRNEKAVRWISPTFQAIHPISAEKPEEDVLLLDLHFMSSSSEAILNVPSYAHWLSQQDQSAAYEYERKLLLLLQWQRKGKYWVLKSPHHLEYMDDFVNIFPEARIIWMHRDLSTCIPSFLSMLYYSRAMFSDQVSIAVIKEHWMAKIQRMLESGLTFRSNNKEAIMDVAYQDLMVNESMVLQGIGNHFSGTISEPVDSMKVNKSTMYKSKHRYELKEWDLNEKGLREYFGEYYKLLYDLGYSMVVK